MALNRQTIHFPFSSGMEQRIGKVHTKPPQLASLINAHWTKIGRIEKRAGFAQLASTIADSNISPVSFYDILEKNGNLLAMTDAGMLAYDRGQTKWADYWPSSPIGLYGSVKTLARLGIPTSGSTNAQEACDACLITLASGGNAYVVVTLENISATQAMATVRVINTSGQLVSIGTQAISTATYVVGAVCTGNNSGSAALCVFGPTSGGDFNIATVANTGVVTFSNPGLTNVWHPASTGTGFAWDCTPCGASGFAIAYDTGATGSLAIAILSATGTLTTSTTPVANVVGGGIVAAVVPGATDFIDVFFTSSTGFGSLYLAVINQSDGTISGSPILVQNVTSGTAALQRTALAASSAANGYATGGNHFDGVALITVDGNQRTRLYYGQAHNAPSVVSNAENTVPESRPFWLTLAGFPLPFYLCAPSDSTQQQIMVSAFVNTWTAAGGFAIAPMLATFGIGRSSGGANPCRLTAVVANGSDFVTPVIWENIFLGAGVAPLVQYSLLGITRGRHGGQPIVASRETLLPSVNLMQVSTELARADAPIFPFGVTATHKTGGVMLAGTYSFVAVLEWVDGDGLRHLSTPSVPATVTIDGSTYQSITLTCSAFDGAGDMGFPILPQLDTAMVLRNCRLVWYRTEANGSVYQRDNFITTSSTNYICNTTDGTLGEDLYTTGNVLENVVPQSPAFIIRSRNRAILIPSETPNMAIASITFADGYGISWNDAIGLQMPEDCIGGGNVVDTPVIGSARGVWRLDGDWPDNTGQGNFPYIRQVMSNAGMIDKRAVLETPVGLIFKTQLGWMLCDLGIQIHPEFGRSVMDSDGLTCTGALALPDRGEAWLYHSDANGTVLVYDWVKGQWSTHQFGTPIAAMCSVAGVPTWLDTSGNVHQEAPGTYQDGSTGVSPIITTGWYPLADVHGYMRLYAIMLLGEWAGMTTIKLQICYDYVEAVVETQTVVLSADGSPTEIKFRPATQKCQAVKLIITVGAPTENAQFYLDCISFDYGAIPGLARIAAGKVV